MRRRGKWSGPLYPTPIKAAGLCCLPVLFLLAVSGCSLIFGSSPPEIDTRTISVEVSPSANHDSPVALDVVYVFDPQLLSQLQMLSADDWFRQRDDIRALYPKKVAALSYELVPGQLGPIVHITGNKEDAIGLFVFAKYQGAGTHRARLDRFEHVVVRLDPTDIVIAPQKS